MGTTTNYNLIKPEASDFFSVEDFNGNADLIDAALKTLQDNKVDKVTGKTLTTNDYTTAEKTKLAAIAAGAEVNQNVYAKVKVGAAMLTADGKQAELTLESGSNIVLSIQNGKLIIETVAEINQNAITSLVCPNVTVQAANKQQPVSLQAGANVTITGDNTNKKVTIAATDTTYVNATSAASGLMSAADKAKLDRYAARSIAYGASLLGSGTEGDIFILLT